MITSAVFRGKRYAVLGLARSGAAAVQALLASGARVTAWDADEERRAQFLPELRSGRGTMPVLSAAAGGVEGRSMVEGHGEVLDTAAPLHQPAAGPPPRSGEELALADPLSIDLTGYDGVVVSPGVPLNTHPIAGHAAAAGVPVIGDIELFAQARASLPPRKVVGVTGTNGKSTTTALIHHICRAAGIPSLMGGNIGLPILAQDPLPEGGVYVLELSSFQIDLTRSLACEIAVLLNITPDHLDRYASFDAYAESKRRLFRMQKANGVAVIAVEDDPSRAIAAGVEGGLIGVTAADCGDQSEWPALQGPHNAQNASAACAVAKALGIGSEAIELAMRTYPGLPHRMERVRERAGVLWVNDSKATNPTSTAPALGAFDHIHWIVGGLAKTGDLGPMADRLGAVDHAYTIGRDGPMFAALLAGKVPVTESGTLDRAVGDAAAAAGGGDTVLLSPACASYDQFRDYEARGDAFRDAVGALA